MPLFSIHLAKCAFFQGERERDIVRKREILINSRFKKKVYTFDMVVRGHWTHAHTTENNSTLFNLTIIDKLDFFCICLKKKCSTGFNWFGVLCARKWEANDSKRIRMIERASERASNVQVKDKYHYRTAFAYLNYNQNILCIKITWNDFLGFKKPRQIIIKKVKSTERERESERNRKKEKCYCFAALKRKTKLPTITITTATTATPTSTSNFSDERSCWICNWCTEFYACWCVCVRACALSHLNSNEISNGIGDSWD